MTAPTLRSLVGGFLLLLGTGQAQALSFVYDYSYDTGFFNNNAQARATLEAAGNFFADRLVDNLLAIDSAGSNAFNISFFNPATGGATQLNNVDIATDTLRIIVGARSLGSGVLGQGGPGGFSVSGSGAFLLNATTRGQGGFGAINGITAFEFSIWGGALSFNSNANWHFDLANPPNTGRFDFLSVALHEFAHLLGIGTSDAWNNRVAPGPVFTGAASVALHGGNVPLGDADHWQNGLQSTVADGPESWITTAGLLRETALDPSLTGGQRKLVTDLDLAALVDVGWQVVEPAAVPLPLPLWSLGAAVAVLLVRRRTS